MADVNSICGACFRVNVVIPMIFRVVLVFAQDHGVSAWTKTVPDTTSDHGQDQGHNPTLHTTGSFCMLLLSRAFEPSLTSVRGGSKARVKSNVKFRILKLCFGNFYLEF